MIKKDQIGEVKARTGQVAEGGKEEDKWQARIQKISPLSYS